MTSKLAALSADWPAVYGDPDVTDLFRNSNEEPYPLLRSVLVKKLYLTEKFFTNELMTGSFVSTLLEQLGFFEGSLAVVPQMRLPLRFGDGAEESVESGSTETDFIFMQSLYPWK
jgi:hypothetical protein